MVRPSKSTCREVTLEKHVNRDHDALGILSAIPETVASFGLPPVKTRVPTIPAGPKDLLPRAQVEPTVRNRYNRLAAHPLPFSVDVAVVLTGLDTTFRSQPAQIPRHELVPGVAQRDVPLIAPDAAEVG